MSEMNENISSFQNHIMSKILMSDNIVRALADDRKDFLSNRYEISNEMIPDYEDPLTPREIITDTKIHRFALKHCRVLPYLDDNDIIEEQSTSIFFDVSSDISSEYVIGTTGKNNLVVPYEIYINIYCHKNVLVTDYSKLRSVYLSEEIHSLMAGSKIGRGASTSGRDVKLIYDRPQSLMNGRIQGRNMLWITAGIEGCM